MCSLDDEIKKALDNISKEPSNAPKVNMKDPRYDSFTREPIMKDPQSLNEGFDGLNLEKDK